MLSNSNLGRTFLFLTELAWKSRVALPTLIMLGCMVFNFRGEIEINIHMERIAVQDLPDGGRPFAAAFGGIAIGHLEDYTDDEEDDEDDDDDDDDDDDYEDDEQDEYYYDDDDEEEDDDDEDDDDDESHGDEVGDEEPGTGRLNGTIRINRYALVNFQNPPQ